MIDIKVMENLAKLVAPQIISAGLTHSPTLITESEDGQVLIAQIILPDNKPKKLLNECIRTILIEHNSNKYVFVAELWQTTFKESNETLAFIKSGKQITDLPLDDRKSILSIFCVEKNKPPKVIYAEILDIPEGRKLADWIERQDPNMYGYGILESW